MRQHTSALNYLKEALRIYSERGFTEETDPDRIWKIYDDMAVACSGLNDADSEIKYYEKAISIVMCRLAAAPEVKLNILHQYYPK